VAGVTGVGLRSEASEAVSEIQTTRGGLSIRSGFENAGGGVLKGKSSTETAIRARNLRLDTFHCSPPAKMRSVPPPSPRP
jgi:hypothetical protein